MVSVSAGPSGRAAIHIGYLKQTRVAEAAPNHSVVIHHLAHRATLLPYPTIIPIGSTLIEMSNIELCSISLSKDIDI